ncbi:hypothetical protein HanXRQr2_Chr09g0396641 [Helianthus annuus]|uniref:Uncharacterized protein n=1 Tax=Helianthus annuus TaxID=4232 RepID=A0A251T675_HELAN|nr:hypothetical protein HanXRQr2_Chr09g0396641 [Helianthus annuus]KAJ0893847.1 hypothetical protein HanPSC8_Chr09g0382401 [Helianthus annuus]
MSSSSVFDQFSQNEELLHKIIIFISGVLLRYRGTRLISRLSSARKNLHAYNPVCGVLYTLLDNRHHWTTG